MNKISPICVLLLILFLCQYLANGSHVSLTHVDSYGSYTNLELISRAVHRTMSRHDAMRSMLEQSSTLSGSSKIQWNSASYIMELSIGTPPVTLLSIMDTGSNLIWTQCKPCSVCFDQMTPIFNPAKSTSFSVISCNSPECTKLQLTSNTSCSTTSNCQYNYEYADRSYTIGSLSTETLTFASSTRGSVSVPNVVFGCSSESSSRSFEGTSGVVGLSMGDFSLVDHLDVPRFSYCLTPFFDYSQSTLLLGSNTCSSSINATSTPIVINSAIPSLYYINLKGISIGGDSLQIPANAFEISSDGLGGMIIDSGSTFTSLVSSAYTVVRAKIESLVNLPVSSNTINLAIDLCFDFKSKSMPTLPDMILHFDGGDLVLPKENYMVHAPDSGLLCLAMIESSAISILGAYQQQNMHVIYHVGNKMLSFEPAHCSKFHCNGTSTTDGTISSGHFDSSLSLFLLILEAFIVIIFT